jgi:ribosomal protein S12 methylthiotransferase
VARSYWVETLGCPKNQVDSDKLIGTLEADGLTAAVAPEAADLVVVNTCAFIEAAREESVATVLSLAAARRPGAELVVTGCLAERYGADLADAIPEATVAGFGVPLTLSRRPERQVPAFDLLNLPRPRASAPWAYVKIAEGCDRTCGFCAIPSFRGRQRSRSVASILAEVEALGTQEIVLVAQDLASYGRDDHRAGAIVPLVHEVAALVPRTRLLYLYPSELTDGLIDVIGETGVPYFDLSLQHVAKVHLRRMRRWGDRGRFLERIAAIRRRFPEAAFRSSFIVGYPGETENDHDQLLGFLDEAQLDWAGFFPYSAEEGTYSTTLPDPVPPGLMTERLREVAEVQDAITASKRIELIGSDVEVLVDRPGVARSHREAPEIDGIIAVPTALPAGSFARVTVTGAAGPDLEAVPAGAGG